MTTVLTTDLQLDSARCEQARQLGGHATPTEVLQKALLSCNYFYDTGLF